MLSLTHLLTLWVLLLSSIVNPVSATQDKPPLKITLDVLQEESWVGARTAWQVTLEPAEAKSVKDVTLFSADRTVWQPVETVTLPDPVKRATTFTASVVPIRAGKLTPAARIRYTIDGEEHETFVRAIDSVEVRPVTNAVTASIIGSQAVRVGDTVTLTMAIDNKMPFTLREVQVTPLANSLRWTSLPNAFDLLPGESRYHTIRASVRHAKPTPQLRMRYQWYDDLGMMHKNAQIFSGSPLSTREVFWADVPMEIVAVFLGVIASVITTALTRLLEQRIERRDQRAINRRRVLGLLSFMLTRAAYAADHSETLDLDPLETLMKEESLYATLDRNRLAKDVQYLWEAGEAHNRGLTEPDGLQRSKKLQRITERIRSKLNTLRDSTSQNAPPA
jgi:hypothetical protein